MNSSSGNQQQPNRSNKANQNIQVYVRVRPLNTRERLIRSHEVVEVIQPKEIIVRHISETKVTKKFTFDRAFGQESKQCEVYHSVVSPLIEEVLAGYNCTVFAYGQTGTGKTHTMIGTECPELKSSWEDESMVGIIPRALSHLFDELRMMEVEFSMRISYLELYNEELCDLLSSDDSSKIRIFDDGNKKGSVIIQGLEEIPVHSKNDVYKLLEKGKERRKTATTLMNAQSSRSHTVFSILVHIKENGIDGEEMLKIGKLNLVDLAGSENITKAGNEKGIRTRETVNINQSLLTLGRVITALVERTPHIPYRESKLTRILQESLGGRTKTSIIATISPGHKDIEETLSTLEYAHRAKNIQNKPEINQKLTKKTVLKEYTEEIDRLKRDLMAARDKNGIYLAEETYNDMAFKIDSQNKELNEKVLLIKALKEDLASKERLFNEVSMHLIEKSDELMRQEKHLTRTKSELDQTMKVLNTTKRRYKEKKVLLDSHVKTEKDLTEQATKLIEVADVATTDTIKLHDTIERRKDVDGKINSACEQFVKKMQHTLSSMEKSVDELQNEHQSVSKLIIDDSETNVGLHQKFSENILSNVQNISDCHKNALIDICGCIEKYSKNLSEMSIEKKEIVIPMINEIKQKANECTIKFKESFMKIENLLNQQNSTWETSYAKIVENIELINNTFEKRLNQMSEQTSKFITETGKLFENEITKICQNIQQGKDISQKRQKIIEDFVKKMQDVENEEKEEKLIFENTPKNITIIKNNIEQQKTDEMNSFKEFNNECTDTLQSTKQILSEFKNKNLSLETECRSEINYGKNLITVFNNDQVKKTNEISNAIEEQCNKHIEVIEQENVDIISKKNEFSTVMEDNINSVESTIKVEYDRIKLHKVENFALQSSLQNCIKDYTAKYNNHISECAHNLDVFYKNEIKTYTPTGQTPGRKEFSYPRILAATSPHNRIIKRFRLEKDWSDLDTTSTITEDSETTAVIEISDDDMILDSVNSTPIKTEPIDKLKNIHDNFNFKIPVIPTKMNESNNSEILQKSSPMIMDIANEENKENCI